jgi:hypothetical protein
MMEENLSCGKRREWWAVGEKIATLGHEQGKYHGTGDRACLRDFKLDQAWEGVAHLCAMTW